MQRVSNLELGQRDAFFMSAKKARRELEKECTKEGQLRIGPSIYKISGDRSKESQDEASDAANRTRADRLRRRPNPNPNPTTIAIEKQATEGELRSGSPDRRRTTVAEDRSELAAGAAAGGHHQTALPGQVGDAVATAYADPRAVPHAKGEVPHRVRAHWHRLGK